MHPVRRARAAAFLGLSIFLIGSGQSWARGHKHKRRVILDFPEGMTSDERLRVAREAGVTVVYDLGGAQVLVVELSGDGDVPGYQKLRSHPRVMEVEEDYYANWLKMDAAPALPSFESVKAGLPRLSAAPAPGAAAGPQDGEAPWGVLKVNAPAVWNKRDGKTQGQGVRVAVIDTGVDCSHPDLNCDLSEGYNALDPEATPFDDNEHGTHVAGTIAGRWDGKGVVGVAPLARIIPVKALDKTGGGDVSGIINGIVWAAQHNVDVINMSLGDPTPSRALQRAVAYALSKGVTIVAAAGNSGPADGTVSYPGAYDGVIAVSASGPDDSIAKFSSRGPQVSFIAPGVDVLSTVPGGGYKKHSGTSMAAPHVAGLAALAISYGGAGSPSEVASLFQGAAKPLCRAGSCLDGDQQGGGLIDASKLGR